MIPLKVHHKVVRTIASCNTMDQAMVAERYAILAYNFYRTRHDWPNPDLFLHKVRHEAEHLVCRKMGVEFK